MLTVSVENALAERTVLDTGWSGNMAFFDYFTRRYPQAFSPAEQVGSVDLAGVGGTVSADVFRLRDVSLGPLHLHDFFADRVPPGAGYNTDADGLIGNVLLAKFVVNLDYTHGAVYLTPTAQTKRELTPLKS